MQLTLVVKVNDYTTLNLTETNVLELIEKKLQVIIIGNGVH